MINKGIVTAVEGDVLTVVFERHEACGDCHACMHGSTDCAKHTVKIKGKADVGDEIVVEMDDSQVMAASATAYLIPFAGMMLGLGAGWLLGGMQSAINRELVAAACAGQRFAGVKPSKAGSLPGRSPGLTPRRRRNEYGRAFQSDDV